jgi:hypothetical protein
MAEPIVVILQTWERTDVALRTIAAARQHLRYERLLWYLADDGSREAHVAACLDLLMGPALIGYHTERRGYGANANAAMAAAHAVGALTFWLEDDWELRQPLDLYPYAALLMERDDIGMVRLGYLNAGIRGHAIGHGDRLYWALDREPIEPWQCVFTGHPSLRHTRYPIAYGSYPIGLTPGDTELAYAYQYRVGGGPSIVWPADYPTWGMFSHIGTVKTETML